MHEMILCKLGEVVLKGLNRRSFEDKLMSNVNRRVSKCGNFRVYSKQSTIYVEPKDDECDIEAAFESCKKVFGIIAVSKALPCEKDIQKIIAAAKEYLACDMRAAKSFKVESKRADKTFPLTSIQISQQVGGALHQAFPTCEVNVHDPELVVHIEIRDDAAYVHGPAEEGAGGLPIGMGGVAVSLLSGGIDSPVSSYMIAKRGVKLEMVHFFSPPYTSDAAKEKVLGWFTGAARDALADKLRVIPNGLDPAWLDGVPRTAAHTPVRVGFAGRMNERKRPLDALNAAHEAGYAVAACGDGPLKEAFCAAMRPQDRYLGRISGMDAMKAFYADCDVLLVPSSAETFGMVYLEAMSQGVPVLYTKGQGFDGQFPEGEVGYAVPCGDVRAQAQALGRVMQGYAERSKRCIEGARRYAWPRIAGMWMELYRELPLRGSCQRS